MILKDRRIRLTNEILDGIKIIKFYAWEDYFQRRIMNIRKEEMVILRKTSYLHTAVNFIWICTPFLVTI